MDIEEEIVVVESVGGVDGPLACEDVATNNSNIESVRPILGNLLENKYYNLFKFKLHFGNHTTKVKFAGDSLL
jgi:hypothetical protein